MNLSPRHTRLQALKPSSKTSRRDFRGCHVNDLIVQSYKVLLARLKWQQVQHLPMQLVSWTRKSFQMRQGFQCSYNFSFTHLCTCNKIDCGQGALEDVHPENMENRRQALKAIFFLPQLLEPYLRIYVLYTFRLEPPSQVRDPLLPGIASMDAGLEVGVAKCVVGPISLTILLNPAR